jgi:outer membrane protein
MNCRLASLALALLFAIPAVAAQSSGSGAAAAPTKVGVINLQQAIIGTAEGKKAAADLQSQFAPRQIELQDLQKQIDEVRGKLQAGQTSLSPDEKAALSTEEGRLTRLFQRKQQEGQEDFSDAQQDIVNRLGLKVVDILAKYGKINGFAIIADNSSQQTPIVFSANQIDVTQDIIRLYDQSFPVKVGSAAPRPVAPKAAPANPQP